MLPIGGIYEVAIRVKDLARAEVFYKDTLGLEEGYATRAGIGCFYAQAGMPA